MKGQRDRLLLQRWRILFGSSYQIKLLVFIAILFSTALLAKRSSHVIGWNHVRDDPRYHDSRNRYTVLINTWKREDLLKKSVAHYASCKGVDSFRIVWSEPESPSSELEASLRSTIVAKSRMHAGYDMPDLRFDINREDNLNNRFKPIDGLKTEAVFSVDDDVLVSCDTMEFAFNVWLSAKDSMVGFVPRMHWLDVKNGQSRYKYGGWWSVWWTGTYSMVLSKVAFFHSKYLDMYTHEMPKSIRDYVASQRNCEDIAMSFLVANATGAPPIWVKGHVVEIGSTGISSLTGHSHRRSRCINHFATLFNRMPLVPTNVKAVNARRELFW